MQIHARKMNCHPDINFDELSRCCDDFNGKFFLSNTEIFIRSEHYFFNLLTMYLGAQCKAVAVEAGMLALRRDAEVINHEDFMEAIIEVQAKKKANLQYYA